MDFKKRFFKNKEEVILFGAFIVFTVFLLYQHFMIVSWDFSVYILNAKYLFFNGSYFEPARPPLMQLVLPVLSVFGWKFAEYVYIVLVSVLFLYSTVRLADSLKWSRVYLYLISLNVFIFSYGLLGGTELLAFCFLELFLSSLISGKLSGHYLGFATLTRYFNISYSPLLLFSKDLKSFFKNALGVFFVVLPWLLYNKVRYGSMLFSIANSYALNVAFRSYIHSPMDIKNILFSANILLPFLLLGFFISFYFVFSKKKKFSVSKKVIIIMGIFLFISLYEFSKIPIKDIRYIFPCFLPFIFFSYIGVEQISDSFKEKEKVFLILILVITLISLLFIFVKVSSYSHYEQDVFKRAVEVINDKQLDGCVISSNAWPHINYYGITTKIYPWQELAKRRLSEGEIIILFRNFGEDLYEESFIKELPVFYEEKEFLIICEGESCIPQERVDESYLFRRNQINIELFGKEIETEPCNIMFKNSFMRNVCVFFD